MIEEHSSVSEIIQLPGNHVAFSISAIALIGYEKAGIMSVWIGQRDVDLDRVKEIYDYQRALPVPAYRGTILIAKLGDKYLMYDGQHRYRSMIVLIEDNGADDFPVMIEICEVESEKDVMREFIMINQSVAMPKHYFTPDAVLNETYMSLLKSYPGAFSNNPKCFYPSMTADMFKNGIIKSEIIKTMGITDRQTLIDIFLSFDDACGDRGVEYWVGTCGIHIDGDDTRTKARATMRDRYNKVEKKGMFYVGLNRNSFGGDLRKFAHLEFNKSAPPQKAAAATTKIVGARATGPKKAVAKKATAKVAKKATVKVAKKAVAKKVATVAVAAPVAPISVVLDDSSELTESDD